MTISMPQVTGPGCSSAASTGSTARCGRTDPTAVTTGWWATSTSDWGAGMLDAFKLGGETGLIGVRQACRTGSVVAALAVALLSGCAQRDSITVGAVPDDY